MPYSDWPLSVAVDRDDGARSIDNNRDAANGGFCPVTDRFSRIGA